MKTDRTNYRILVPCSKWVPATRFDKLVAMYNDILARDLEGDHELRGGIVLQHRRKPSCYDPNDHGTLYRLVRSMHAFAMPLPPEGRLAPVVVEERRECCICHQRFRWTNAFHKCVPKRLRPLRTMCAGCKAKYAGELIVQEMQDISRGKSLKGGPVSNKKGHD